MPYEVVNTSAVRGLTTGHSGYCDVLRTRGLPEEITQLLAPLNFYNEKLARGNSVCGVRSIRFGGGIWGIVSRVLPNGNDYTGRTNRLAHHVIAAPSELASLCPASILAGYTFRDTFTDTPRYLDREPEIQVVPQSFGEVWDDLGGNGWRTHIAKLAMAGSRVVVLIPTSVDGKSVVASILLGIPLVRRWEIGVAEASSAEQCWAQNVLVRILSMDLADASSERRWPGEEVVDLRRKAEPPSEQVEVPVEKDSVKLDFGAFVQPRQELRSVGIEESLQPIAVNENLDSPSVGKNSLGVTPSRTSRPSDPPMTSTISWKLTIVWLLLGAIVGAVTGLFVVNL